MRCGFDGTMLIDNALVVHRLVAQVSFGPALSTVYKINSELHISHMFA